MTDKVLALLGILFITLLVISCGDEADDNPFLGTWSVVSIDGEPLSKSFETEGIDNITATSEWTFDKDGTWQWITKVEGPLSFEIELSGTYAITGSTYTFTVDGDSKRLTRSTPNSRKTSLSVGNERRRVRSALRTNTVTTPTTKGRAQAQDPGPGRVQGHRPIPTATTHKTNNP